MTFDWTAIGRSFLRSLVPVALTYSAAILGIELFGNDIKIEKADNTKTMGLLIVPLFTVTHAVIPIFFYRLFFIGFEAASKQLNQTARPFGCLLIFPKMFILFHMGFWYGVPSLFLAFFTGWLTIPATIIHIACAKRGTRTWVFLEYGSTSMALLLYVMIFSGENLFPNGILIVIFQILMLTVVNWKGRGLWVKESRFDESIDLTESIKDF